MKHRIRTTYHSLPTLTSSLLDKSAKRQMQKSKTSERKSTQLSLIFHLFFLCSFLSFSSCSRSPDYDFHTSKDAIQTYRAFHHEIAAKPTCKGEEFVSFVKQWHELSDTVLKYIAKDPAFTAHCTLSIEYQMMTDSVRSEFMRLSECCSLKDLALVKLATGTTNEFTDIAALKALADAFFTSLDKNAIYEGKEVSQLKTQYLAFLDKAQSQDFRSMDDVKAFLTEEDRHFRTFLSHIDAYSTLGVAEITTRTKRICSKIFDAAADKHLKAEEAMVYMAMRTNRRLFLNADLCAQLIQQNKVSSPEKANAYLWMVIQPFLSTVSFDIAMLNESQQKQFLALADDYPKLVDQLISRHLCDKETANKLPSQLMRLYLSIF